MEIIVNIIQGLIIIVGSILTWIIVGFLLCAILFGIKYLIWKENPPIIIHKLILIIVSAYNMFNFEVYVYNY